MTFLPRLLPWLLPRLMLVIALWRWLRGQETAQDLSERLGGLPRGPEPLAREIWIHGASNGELASARWLIEALSATAPVLVTASTVTGRALVQGWNLPHVRAGLAPLDLGIALRRFGLPRALVNLEAEIWPLRFRHLAAAGVPIAMVGARMSARSARRWQRLSASGGTGFLAAVGLASAQDSASQARLAALGLGNWIAPCDLKAEALARAPAPQPRPRAERARILLAASTHAGEEARLLDDVATSPFDLLILAPRHPKRGDEVARLITDRGHALWRRSEGADLPARGVYLADTLGEMDLWYGLAGACFVGGSLVDHGGHTPWEPMRHGAAILHGPHVGNFAETYAALDALGGARAYGPGVLQGLDGETQDRMAASAQSLRGAARGEALIAALMTLIAGK